MVTIQVPVGKRIEIDKGVSRRLNWFHMGGGNNYDWDDEWNNYENWSSNVEYIMTPGGLERVKKQDGDKNDDNNDGENNAVEKYKKSKDELQKEYEKKQREAEDLKKELDKPVDTTQYHYKRTVSVADTPKSLKTSAIPATTKNREQEPVDISLETSKILMMQMIQ